MSEPPSSLNSVPRQPLLIVTAALTVFWIVTIAVATVKAAPGGGKTESGVVSVLATIVFFFFTLPALLFAFFNQWLAFGAVLAGIALVIDMVAVLFWILN